MALQLPVSLVGYHTHNVDETLNRVMNALSERDTRIAVLEQRVAELLAGRLQARQEIHAGPLGAPAPNTSPSRRRSPPSCPRCPRRRPRPSSPPTVTTRTTPRAGGRA